MAQKEPEKKMPCSQKMASVSKTVQNEKGWWVGRVQKGAERGRKGEFE